MPLTRSLTQPGPVAARRIDSFDGPAKRIAFTLLPGLSLCEAIAGPLVAAGLRSAAVVLGPVRFNPFRYVIPAVSPTPDHAAYYSDTFMPDGTITIDRGTATYGSRDGQPFVHCHALWRDDAGGAQGGHILPADTVLAEPATAMAYGSQDIAMESAFDPETNFTLFAPSLPIPRQNPDATTRLVVARIRPNEDLVESIEAVCRLHRITRAVVRSGIGSLVGAAFEDGRHIAEIPTEILVLNGHVTEGADGRPRAAIEIALIDRGGAVHHGIPTRGRNPVLICCELFLEWTDQPPARSAEPDLVA
jgi:predicted DNA-binding protein with PD1-like motif